ncbi:MAG: RDD family protein [Elusimicrobia bacterium]|nr:RDD family protein [Elusimicrobiota bacterium]
MDEQQPIAAAPAKITDRFLAYLLDTVPFGVGYHASAIYLIDLTGRVPEAGRMKLVGAWVGLYVLYHALGNAMGATIGKALMGLRLDGPDGDRPSVGRAILRAFAMLLSTPMNAGFLWSFIDRDSRTWHDIIAGTRVVEARPKTRGEAVTTALASFVTLVGLLVVSFWANGLRPTNADLDAVAKAQQGLLVLAEVQESYKAAHGSYTNSLSELAVASGDVAQFKAAMGQIFDPEKFLIAANETRYSITARARDRRRTTVSFSGPASQP